MGGGLKMDDDDGIISEINVTPFVDIALVLLIIFIVTATYIVAQSIPVDLPEAGTGEEITSTMVISIDKNGITYLDGDKADRAKITKTIEKTKTTNKDLRVIIAADKTVDHGSVVGIIDLVRKLGVSKFAINIDAEQEK